MTLDKSIPRHNWGDLAYHIFWWSFIWFFLIAFWPITLSVWFFTRPMPDWAERWYRRIAY